MIGIIIEWLEVGISVVDGFYLRFEEITGSKFAYWIDLSGWVKSDGKTDEVLFEYRFSLHPVYMTK